MTVDVLRHGGTLTRDVEMLQMSKTFGDHGPSEACLGSIPSGPEAFKVIETSRSSGHCVLLSLEWVMHLMPFTHLMGWDFKGSWIRQAYVDFALIILTLRFLLPALSIAASLSLNAASQHGAHLCIQPMVLVWPEGDGHGGGDIVHRGPDIAMDRWHILLFAVGASWKICMKKSQSHMAAQSYIKIV